jgi:hypothetical protein
MCLKIEPTTLRRAPIGLSLIFLLTFGMGVAMRTTEKAKDAESRNSEIDLEQIASRRRT